MFDALDDMVAALANSSIYVVPLTFTLAPEGKGMRVKLSQVGLHMTDSYDFEGEQDLGYWDEASNQASVYWHYDWTRVTNQSFRDWRQANQKGGDFRVFSDVKTLTLAPPESFLI